MQTESINVCKGKLQGSCGFFVLRANQNKCAPLISLEIIISAKSRDLNIPCIKRKKKTCTKVSEHILFEGSFDFVRVF